MHGWWWLWWVVPRTVLTPGRRDIDPLQLPERCGRGGGGGVQGSYYPFGHGGVLLENFFVDANSMTITGLSPVLMDFCNSVPRSRMQYIFSNSKTRLLQYPV